MWVRCRLHQSCDSGSCLESLRIRWLAPNTTQTCWSTVICATRTYPHLTSRSTSTRTRTAGGRFTPRPTGAVELSAQFGEVVPARGVNSGPSRGSGKTRGRPAMVRVIRRLAIAGAAAFVPVAFVTVVCPGVSNAAECGFGTVFDPPTTLVWRHHFHRHCHLRRPRRQLGTAISRRTSRSVSARPFRSCRCAPASNPTGGARHGAKQPLTCCCV